MKGKRKKIRLTTTMGKLFRETQATVFGVFAVHKSVPTDVNGDSMFPDGNSWSVTHVPTGLSVGMFALELEREDAERIAHDLDATGEFRGEEMGEDSRWICEATVAMALETPS